MGEFRKCRGLRLVDEHFQRDGKQVSTTDIVEVPDSNSSPVESDGATKIEKPPSCELRHEEDINKEPYSNYQSRTLALITSARINRPPLLSLIKLCAVFSVVISTDPKVAWIRPVDQKPGCQPGRCVCTSTP